MSCPAAVLDAWGDPPPAAALTAAVAALGAGQVVGVPTDTVYGLAVDATCPGAADRVFAAKSRPRGVELPLLVGDADDVDALTTEVPAAARALMRRFWPGALTIVLARHPGLGMDLGDNRATVGVRCPDHPVIRSLCRMVGPLATTSANRHGEPPAVEAPAVARMGGVDLVLDGGRCEGQPSTVVDCTGSELRILRAGRISRAAVEAVGRATPGHA